ncbi:nucleotidyl transferase AbiEii/AbiGii toxin family protein [Anaerorhabdus sp.]|uniref:nucleotidyl transferase AbiEii/AbiGii toxin family protein n=1 Tax=Anaerorhabdus sp. TaxID=1872524 RepID=UPI002FC9A699
MEFKNVDSWKQYIKRKSTQLGVTPHELQQIFLLECFAKKISKSKYRENFIFKGGFIMSSIIGVDTRSTRDIDLTWKSIDYSIDEITTIMNEVNEINIGIPIFFTIQRIKKNIKENASSSYQISLKAIYDTVTFDLKLDVTNGTLVYPDAIEYPIKSNFSEEYINVKSYAIENIIAEKLETVLSRGEYNGRMRDYFDLYMIEKIGYEYNKELLFETIIKVSKSRGTVDTIYKSIENIEKIQNSEQFKLFWGEYCNIQIRAKDINMNHMFDFLYHLCASCKEYLSRK